MGINSCNGITFNGTNQARLTSLEVDKLAGTSKFVTDFTSIGNLNKFLKKN